MYFNFIWNLLFGFAIMAGNSPPAPTPEVTQLIKDLGHKKYKNRESATRQLLDLRYTSLKACMDASNHSDPEIGQRSRQIVYFYYANVYKEKYPSIYCLEDKLRYPFGVSYEKDVVGWCKNLQTTFDLGVYYFQKAKKLNQKNDSFTVYEYLIKDEYLEAEATKLYVKDLLYKGKSYEFIQNMLKEMHDRRNLNVDGYNSAPGPAVHYSEIPEGSELYPPSGP